MAGYREMETGIYRRESHGERDETIKSFTPLSTTKEIDRGDSVLDTKE